MKFVRFGDIGGEFGGIMWIFVNLRRSFVDVCEFGR